MLDVNKYRKINAEAKNRQQELDKQIKERVERELSIIESVIDTEIAKNELITHIKIKMDLHSRTVDKLTKGDFVVDLNSTTGEYIISWNKDVYNWNSGAKPIKRRNVTKNENEVDIYKYEPKSESKHWVCDETMPKEKIIFEDKDERTITKDEDVSFSITGGNDKAYFINGVSVSRDEYMSKYVDFLKKYGLLS